MSITEIIGLLANVVDPSWLELIEIGQRVATPDGRWCALQDWLKRNPKHGKQIEEWFNLEPYPAYVQLRNYLISESKKPAMLRMLMAQFMTSNIEDQIIRSITNLQTLYRERQGEKTEKEIKNVKTARQVGRGSGKHPRRANARTKRTDQT